MKEIKPLRIGIYLIVVALILSVVFSPLVNDKQVLAGPNTDQSEAAMDFTALLPIAQYRSSPYAVDTIFLLGKNSSQSIKRIPVGCDLMGFCGLKLNRLKVLIHGMISQN